MLDIDNELFKKVNEIKGKYNERQILGIIENLEDPTDKLIAQKLLLSGENK